MTLQVSFIGLGAMGFGMATHLVQQGFDVAGFDVSEPTLARFAAAGGQTAATPAAAAAGRPVCVCMVATAAQVQQVLVDGPDAAAPALPQGAAILLCSTVPCAFVQRLAKQLASPKGPVRRPDLHLVDAPVSGGAVRAAIGTLSIMASGDTAIMGPAAAGAPGRRVLAALADPSRLCLVHGGIGAGSNTKMVHQVLATVQVLAAAEGFGLGLQLGLAADEDTRSAIVASPGGSWMFAHRSQRMLTHFQPVASAVQIAAKDVAIITAEARRAGFLPLMTSVADNCFVAALARGWKLDDDSSLLRLYADDDGTRAMLPGAVSTDDAVCEAGAGRHTLQIVVGLLKGIHLAAAAEALAMAHALGLDLDQVLALCIDAAGGSAVLEAHGPAIVAALHNGTAATGWPLASDAADSLQKVFQDVQAAVQAAQMRRASLYLGNQTLNILTLAKRLLGGDASKLDAGSIIKVWVA